MASPLESELREAYFNPLPEGSEDPEILNSLLRGEISAAETYNMAINRLEGRPFIDELRQIRDDHHSAMRILQERLRAHGADAAQSSGAWGAFASVVTGTAMTLGATSVLSALRQGEEHGISEYQKAANGDISAESRMMIEGDLLPRCRQHVAALERISASLS
jgi:hypothetical protein